MIANPCLLLRLVALTIPGVYQDILGDSSQKVRGDVATSRFCACSYIHRARTINVTEPFLIGQ